MAKNVSPSYTPSSDAQPSSGASKATPTNTPSQNTPAEVSVTSNVPASTNAPASSAPSTPNQKAGSGDTNQNAVESATVKLSDADAYPVQENPDNWKTGFGPYADDKKVEDTSDEEKSDYYKNLGLPRKDRKAGIRMKVRLLHGVPVKHDGEKYLVVVTTEGDTKGYLVKPDQVENNNKEQLVDVSDAIELYDWDAELSVIFENIEAIKRNALLSFWKAGALFETDKADAHIRETMFDSAFPYRMP